MRVGPCSSSFVPTTIEIDDDAMIVVDAVIPDGYLRMTPCGATRTTMTAKRRPRIQRTGPYDRARLAGRSTQAFALAQPS